MIQRKFRHRYGASGLHLLALFACFGLTGYCIAVLGLSRLWGSGPWWQSILVWFVASLVLHDAVLFPLYAIADRAITMRLLARIQNRPKMNNSSINYVRVPALASSLTFIVFLPGIIQHGAPAFFAATGQTQAPFLGRWLVLTAVFFTVSASVYAIRVYHAHRSSKP